MKAHSDQFRVANQTLQSYGHDTTGNISYTFNEHGFRMGEIHTSSPEILFAGGSISFGIGVVEEETYKGRLAAILGKSYWDLSYANSYYNNFCIYQSLIDVYELVGPLPIIVQWVSDLRNKTPKDSVYEYINQINTLYPKHLHIYVDGRESKENLRPNIFDLINPIWIDSSAMHPGPLTHLGLAKYLMKIMYDKKFFTHTAA